MNPLGGMNPMQVLMQMMNGGGNPQALLQNALQNNPRISAILNQQRQSGMSMEQFVRDYAQKNNVDINPMVDFLRKRGIK